MHVHDHDIDQAKVHDGAKPKRDDESSATAFEALRADTPEAVSPASLAGLQRDAGNASVSRLVQRDEEEQGPSAHDVVGKGGGAPLDAGTRSFMESQIGADFSDVRVHTDATASESAKNLHANAYTVGNDIAFQSGQYNPGSDTGQRMLAHELTHVVQQRSGPVDGTPMGDGMKVSDPSDRFEQAAEANADRVMSAQASAQRAAEEEELQGSFVQREMDEEELQGSFVQRQEESEELMEE